MRTRVRRGAARYLGLVIGLPEGDWLRVSGSSIELRGAHPAAWFHAEKVPARIHPGALTPFGDTL